MQFTFYSSRPHQACGQEGELPEQPMWRLRRINPVFTLWLITGRDDSKQFPLKQSLLNTQVVWGLRSRLEYY